MTQKIIDTGAQPDDGQGDPLRTAFSYTNDNFTEIYQAGPVGSDIRIANNYITTMVINSDLVLSPSGIGKIQVNNNVLPRSDDVYELGSSSQRFNAIYLGTGGLNSSGIISTTGNISAGYFIGDGSLLTGITANAGSKLSNGTSNIDIPSAGSNILVSVSGASNVVVFTTTGALITGSVSATGNVSGNYILGNGALLTGLNNNYSNANVAAYLPTYTGSLSSLTGPVVTTANITGGNVAAGNVRAGNVNVSGIVSVTGNVIGGYFIGDGSQLTNLPAANYSNANVEAYLPTYTGNLVSLTGPVITTANVTGGNLRTSGTVSATGNITGGNVATGRVSAGNITVSGPVSASGNITGSYFIGNGSQLTGIVTNYSNANVAAYLPTYTGNLASLTGPVVTTANVVASSVLATGVVSTAGNITGGNIATGRVSAGSITVSGPVSASGNITGSYIIGDGSQLTNLPAGNYSNANVAAYLPTYTGNLASLTGPVITTANVTGGNLRTSGVVSATGNITGGNVDTGRVNAGSVTVSGPISASGNVTGGYFFGDGSQLTNLPAGNYSNANVAAYLPTYTGNLASLTGPVITTNSITGASLSIVGNITGGNIDTGRVNAGTVTVSGPVSATGNITGAYFFGNGSQLTGLPATYSNANVAVYLPTYTGNLASLTGPVITVGNITGGNLRTLGVISATGNITGGNIDTGNVIAGNVIVSGNITGSYFFGDGSQLTNLPAGNYSNANVAAYLPTYTGNLASLTGPVVTTANVQGGNLRTAGAISATGNITGGNIDTGRVNAGTVTVSGPVSAAGNVTGAYFIGDGSQLTNLPAGNYSNANVAAYLPTYTGNLASLTGPVVTTANVQGGNLRTTGVVSATGNIIGGNIDTGNVTAGNVSVFGNVTGSYFIGDGSQLTNLPAGNYSNANVAAYLPTYTGNLASLTGPVITTANVTGGNLRTSGAISATGSISGNTVNTNLLTANAVFVANTISTIGNVVANNISSIQLFANVVSATANVTAGNLNTTGLITATGNIQGGNFNAPGGTFTGYTVSVNGTVTGGNLTTLGIVSAFGNITGGNMDTGNIHAGNMISNAIVTAVGNIYTAQYFIGNGKFLTGLETYSNANVAAFLPTYTGNLVSLTGPVVTTANIVGANFVTSGSITATGTITSAANISGSNLVSSGSITATGNLTAGNLVTNGLATVAGNITGGNLQTAGQISATGNLTGGNVLTAGTVSVAGNVVTDSSLILGNSGKITFGTTGSNIYLSSLSPTTMVINASNLALPGNITSGNITSGNITATNTLTTPNLLTTGVISTSGNIYASNLQVSGTYSVASLNTTGNVNAGNLRTVGQVTATGNITGGNLSTAGNVSGNYFIGNGALLTGIVVSGGTSIDNGASNVSVAAPNSNVTVSVNPVANLAVFSPSGLSVAGNVAGSYLLGNGAFITGVAKASSADSVANGTSNINIPTINGNVTVGVTGINKLAVFSTGGLSVLGNVAGNYILGNGAFLTGLAATYGNADVANYLPTYSGNLPSLTGLVSTTGNIAGNYILGNGALLTGVITSVANINNGTSNVNIASSGGNVTVAVGGTSNVAVFSTSGLVVSGTVSASGNVTGGNIVTNGTVSATGNLVGGNILSSGTISTSGNIVSQNFVGNLVPPPGGVVSTTGNVSGGNVLSSGSISATGNIAGNYFIGNGALLTGVTASSVNANALIGNTLSANVLFSSLTTVGTLTSLSVQGNIDAGNVATAGQVTATGNVTGGNVSTAGAVTATGNVDAGNLRTAGLITATGNVDAGNLRTAGLITATGNVDAGNVRTAGLVTATGNVDAGNVRTAGLVTATGNVTGGNVSTAGQVTATGNVTGGNFVTSGNLSIDGVVIGNLVPAADQYYNLGAPGAAWKDLYLSGFSLILGNQTLTSNTTTLSASNNISAIDVLASGGVTAVGNITGGNLRTAGQLTATGNVTGGNLRTAGLVTATGNITGGNILTAGLMSSTGNGIHGNVLTSGQVTATGNITGGNVSTAGQVTATGNVTGGNLSTAGQVTATGNITGNNIFALGFASIIGNVITANVNASSIRPVTGELSITTATGNLNLQPAGNIVLANTIINSVAYPLQDTDAATKLYVDNMVSTGIAYHPPVSAATTTDLATATGGTITYAQPNGVANGVGATLTTTGSFNLIDTANVQSAGTRILVQNEGNTVFNGVYTWSNATTIVRATDADEYGADSTIALSVNDYFFVQNGNVNKGAAFIVSAPSGTITFGTSGITFSQFSSSQTYTANTNAGLSLVGTQFNAKVDNNTTAFDAGGNIIVKAGANLTTPNIGAATGTSMSLVGNVQGGNLLTTGDVSATGNVTGAYLIGNISGASGLLGNNINLGSNTTGSLVSNAVTLTTSTTVTNGLALLNQVLGKLVPPSPTNFPGATTLTLSGITTYRMANITQVDNTPGANKAVAAGTSVANVLRVATYATNTIANVGPGDSGTITAVRNGSNVGAVTLNAGASPSGNGTYGSNLVISNNFDYNSANANITAGFWYVFSSRISGAAAPAGWNEAYIADSATANTNTTVWYYDNSSPSTPSFSSTTMTPPGSANLLYSSTIPHYTNNNNFTIAFTVANISGNTYPTANTLASGSAGGAFAAPTTITYNQSNIGSNILPAFASASANTTVSVTTGFGGSSTGPSMSVNNSYSTGTLTLTTALGNTVLWKSGTATAIDESNVVINTTIGSGSGNAYRIVNPGTGNTPTYTGSEAAFNSQSSTLQTYDATVVGSGTSGVLKHDQTNYATGYLPAGPNLSSGRSGTQYFTFKFVRTAVSKFDVKYTGNIAGMWVALPGSVIDSSSSANGWINMAVAYGGAGYPGVNAPGNGSDGCAVGGTVSLNTSVTNSSKTCTFGTVSSSSTATNEIYVRIALTAGQSVTALTLETASN